MTKKKFEEEKINNADKNYIGKLEINQAISIETLAHTLTQCWRNSFGPDYSISYIYMYMYMYFFIGLLHRQLWPLAYYNLYICIHNFSLRTLNVWLNVFN